MELGSCIESEFDETMESVITRASDDLFVSLSGLNKPMMELYRELRSSLHDGLRAAVRNEAHDATR